MPFKDFSRDQDWLLPPSLGDLIPVEHPVRFVAEFIDSLAWAEVDIACEAAVCGAPAYAPQVLLAVWLYGFMTRIRSTRLLERACQESVPMMWLTGLQRPDHSTLARFYQRNRLALRALFKQTVRLAVEVGLVEFALQAVDGTRLSAASRASLQSRAAIDQLLTAVEAELAALDAAQREEAAAVAAPRPGPRAVWGREQLRTRLRQARAELDRHANRPGRRHDGAEISTSDPEAALIKAARGFVVGYNAQAVVDSQAQIVVAADVTTQASDGEQLLPMLAEVQAMTGRQPVSVVADSGYFAMAAICEAEQRGLEVVVTQPRRSQPGPGPEAERYSKTHFAYDPATDTYRCPEGKPLRYAWPEHKQHGKPVELRVYQGCACQGCPAQRNGACTQTASRRIKRFEHDADLPLYLTKLQSARGRQIIHQRAGVVEPLFASTKERLGMLRFRAHGLLNAKAEWYLTCAAHNLLKLWRYRWQPVRQPVPCPG